MSKSLFVLALFLCYSTLLAQENYTISGHVRDASTGEELIGVNIHIDKLKVGCATNEYGFYSLTVPAGDYLVEFSYIGYRTKKQSIHLVENLRQDIELFEEAIAIDAVIVTGEVSDDNVKSHEISMVEFIPSEIKSIPVIFGEQDILKTIQLMPGINAGGEGNTGFYVRGGSADQNLVLLDEAPVYNASHLLGFFSVFNSDAIKDVKLFKGTAPAEYGGRLSSTLDIKMKEGSSKKINASGGLGLISSRLNLQGPIIKDKSSFIVSARRTYADLFFKLSSNEKLRESQLYFYDLNMKTNYRFGQSDRIFVSGYLGRDVFGFADVFAFDWGNTTGTMRWNHLFGNKLFLNSSLIYSKYDYVASINNEDDDSSVDIRSSIQDINLKEDFDYFVNPRNMINFGLNAIYHTFLPGEVSTSGENSVNDIELQEKYALENALYFSHEFDVTHRLSLKYGLRYSGFAVIGPGDVYTYDDEGEVTDTTTYESGELIKYYGGVEPRLSFNYLLNKTSSVKLSYARNRQYLHLLSTSTSTTPVDVWQPSTHLVKPGIADQIALGYFRNFDNNNYETSVEIYYKDMQNLIDYKNGADIVLNENVEAELVFGRGWSYGAEFFIKKKFGRLDGWIGYTWSRTQRQFDDINDGEPYSAKEDRTHDISIVGIYDLTEKWTFSATWVYNTGNAVTFPSGKYMVDGHVVNLYTERNGYRMPDYHRLDLGLTYASKNSSWNFSLYNAYGRKNAYAIYFRKSETDPEYTEAVQISLFTFVPSITYNFRF